MNIISQAFTCNQYKILYERKVALKCKYKFKTKNIFQDFIEKITNIIDTNFLLSIKIGILNEFGTIRVTSFEDFKKIIKNSENIYNVDIEIIGEDSNETQGIVASFSELETLKKKSYIKLISTNKEWIKNAEDVIKENLSLHKSSLSFISNSFIKSTIMCIILAIILGENYLEDINQIKFLIILIYGLIILVIYAVIEDVFFPIFKVNAKASYMKRFILRIKQDSFTNILAILSFVVGIIGILLAIFK